jgi:HEAT repeat protein
MQISRRSALALSVFGFFNGSLWAQQKTKPPADKDGSKKPDDKSGKPKPPPVSQISDVAGKNLEAWIKEIDHPDPSIRENAIRTIVMFGPKAGKAAPRLIWHVDRLNDKDTSPRVNAIRTLGAIDFLNDKDVTDAINSLAKCATQDSQTICRYQAAVVLGRFGTEAKSALPALRAATKDGGSWEIRKAAIYALSQACQDPAKGPSDQDVKTLAGPITNNDTSSQVRLEATMALAMMGTLPRASETFVTETLLKASSDRNVPVAIWARVGYMARKGVTPRDLKYLTGLLKDRELEHVCHAARALGTIGDKAKSSVPDLIKLLDHKEPLAQSAAIWALGSIGPGAKEAEEPLRKLLKQNDLSDGDREYINDALRSIAGPKPKPKK